MLITDKDNSIHSDGIYDIDESCKALTNALSIDDRIVFAMLTIFVFLK